MDTLLFVLIGIVAGGLAGYAIHDSGLEIVSDIVVGAFFALIGGQLFQSFGIAMHNRMLDVLVTTGMAMVLMLGLSIIARWYAPYRTSLQQKPYA